MSIWVAVSVCVYDLQFTVAQLQQLFKEAGDVHFTQPEAPLFTPLKRRLIFFFHFNMFGATKPVGVSSFPQRNSARLWFQCLPTECPKIRPSRSVSAYTPLRWCLVDVCSPLLYSHSISVYIYYSMRKFSTLLTVSVSIAPNTRSLTAAQSLRYQILV